MDNGVHVEDSSSQNVNLFVERKKRGASGTTVFLSDGSSFLLHYETADLISLNVHVDVDILLILKQGDEAYKAYKKGFELCARREHSEFQLIQKLVRRGFSRTAIDDCIHRLREARAVDNSRYAEVWVRGQLRKKKLNKSQMVAKLKQAGVSSEIINEVISEWISEESEMTALRNAAEKLYRKSTMTREKCRASLLRRGFTYRDIKKVLDELAFQR